MRSLFFPFLSQQNYFDKCVDMSSDISYDTYINSTTKEKQMKGISVRIRKVTLHTDNGYYGVKWLHPTAVLPEQLDKYCKTYVTCDEIVDGVVVSEPFVHEDNVCVVIQMQNNGRYENYETFWIGHLG